MRLAQRVHYYFVTLFIIVTAAKVCAAEAPQPLAAPSVPAINLTVDGQARAIIVVGHGDGKAASGKAAAAGAGELKLAAKILEEHIRQMSGAALPVVGEAELSEAKIEQGRIVLPKGKWHADAIILVGEGDLAKRMGFTTEGLGAGGIVMKTSGNVLVLMGKPAGSSQGKSGKSGASRKGVVKGAAKAAQCDDGVECKGTAEVGGRKGGAPAAVGKAQEKVPYIAPGGTTYAVCRFLESVGCRYLWPGESGKVVPHLAMLSIPAMDVRYTPPIAQRDIRFLPKGPRNYDTGLAFLGIADEESQKAHAAGLQTESAGAWQAWQGLGGDIGIHGGHSGCGLRGGWTEHGAAHPEWFALQPDGTRDQSKAAERWRLCVSNVGLIDHVAADLIKELDAAPQTTCISLSPNDGGFSSFCMCDECRKLDAPNGPKIKMLMFPHVGKSERNEIEYVSLTDRYVHYWNAVAERVTKVHPKVLFLVDAYSYYSDPPVREKLHPNLVVRYVPSAVEGWKGWQAAGAQRIFWRPNNLHSGYRDGALKVFGGELASTMHTFFENGMFGTDIQGIYDNWATQGMNYYVQARMDWDPKLTYEAILDDYCRSGFGPAAQPVKQYFQKAESLTGTVTEKYTPKVVTELRDMLETARKDAGNDPALKRRVAFLRAGLEHTALTAEAQQLAAQAEAGKPIDHVAAKALMDRRWQLMRAMLLHEPMAVNVALVAGHEEPLRRSLGWSGPSDSAKTTRFKGDALDDWLNEDQRPR